MVLRSAGGAYPRTLSFQGVSPPPGAERPIGAAAVALHMNQIVFAESVQHGPHVRRPQTEQVSQFTPLCGPFSEPRQDSCLVGRYVRRLPSIRSHPIARAWGTAR